MAFWVEKAMVRGFPLRQRAGFEVGAALVSPQKSMVGGDNYRHMRAVQAGDVILHLTNNEAFTVISLAAAPYSEIRLGSELWYRVPLKSGRLLKPALQREVFFGSPFGDRLRSIAESAERQHLFFERRLKLRQGGYLSILPAAALAVLDEAYKGISGTSLVDIAKSLVSDSAGRALEEVRR